MTYQITCPKCNVTYHAGMGECNCPVPAFKCLACNEVYYTDTEAAFCHPRIERVQARLVDGVGLQEAARDLSDDN